MRILQDSILCLPLDRRTAWLACIAESVISLYSPHFRTKYHQDAAVECAWDYAISGDCSSLDRLDLMRRIGEMRDEADSEGYGFHEIGMGGVLLGEIEEQDGKSALAMIDFSALSYASQLLYKQGKNPGDPRIPVEFLECIGAPVPLFAGRLLQYLEKNTDVPIHRGMFGSFQLEFRKEPIEVEMVDRDDLFIPSPPHLEMKTRP